MKPFTKWCAVAVAVAAVIVVARVGQSSLAQEAPVAKKAKSEQARAEKIAAFKTAVANSPTTLSQVIAAAETETGGKAFASEMEMEHGKLVVDVELLIGDKIREVHFDAATGKVITAKAGSDDDDDDDGDDDDDDDDDDDGDDDGR